MRAANAALEDGASEEDAIFACINAAGRSKKHMDKETEVETKEEGEAEVEEKMLVYSPTAVTFSELDEAEAGFVIAQDISKKIEQFHMLVDNTMWDEEISDKGGHIQELAGELSTRIEEGPEEQKEVKDRSYTRPFIKLLKKALGLHEEEQVHDESMIMFVKNSSGEWTWFCRYSNKWRDEDSPPEIISEESHLRFNELVKSNEAPYPELWLWHVNGTAWGKAKWVGYDNQGFALAAGYVYPEFYEVAELFKDKEDILVSHGMPTTSIKRDADDQSIIIEHETREISPLPRWAAANKMTSFVILKENDMEEFKNKGISDGDRKKLIDDLGIPEEAIDRMEEINQKDAKDATEAELEFKEGETKQVADAEIEAEEEPKVEEPQEDLEEEAVDAATSELPEIEELNTAINTLSDAVVALNEKVKALHDDLQTEINEIKSSQDEAIGQLANTPAASRAAYVLQSIVGDEEARVDGRTKLAKDTPKEIDEGSGPFFWQEKGWA